MRVDYREAHEALAGIGEAQGRLAAAMECPPWRHAAFGAIMAALVGSPALPGAMPVLVTGISMLAVALLVQNDRKRMGVFVNGYRKGATLAVSLSLLGVLMVLLFAQVHLRESSGALASKIALALIAFALATAASVMWQRVYIRELTRGVR